MEKLKNYGLVLVYKSTLTKEEVETRINKEIYPIFNKFGITKLNYHYCGNKLFSYIINKLKSGYYFLINFSDTGKNITKIQKFIKENSDVLRAITFSNFNENSLNIISKLDSNINIKDSYSN